MHRLVDDVEVVDRAQGGGQQRPPRRALDLAVAGAVAVAAVAVVAAIIVPLSRAGLREESATDGAAPSRVAACRQDGLVVAELGQEQLTGAAGATRKLVTLTNVGDVPCRLDPATTRVVVGAPGLVRRVTTSWVPSRPTGTTR